MQLDKNLIFNLVSSFLEEDIGRGDITTQSVVSPKFYACGRFLAKQNLVVAGLEVAEAVFASIDPDLELVAFVHDGEEVAAGKELARIEGAASVLLSGERVALNLLQRMSGVATQTRKYAKGIEGTNARVVDTRKTIPGLRMLDKYAVRVGGGYNHRFGLDDGILIKDNHIAIAGGVRAAIALARENSTHMLKIEVEVANRDQLIEALESKADVILLDNMSVEAVNESVKFIKENGQNRNIIVEASGNISLDNIAEYARTGVDLISVGALTHSAPAVDISFKIAPESRV
ncbi:MAG: carboxylating nicotinate-nucleotide diphosphorylase [Blastocatellia bacterium]|nr:carboxylating nicotinate-nucleotide diphosphorylase [Blastocatellia bacterium]